jgi:hypothetical protein
MRWESFVNFCSSLVELSVHRGVEDFPPGVEEL